MRKSSIFLIGAFSCLFIAVNGFSSITASAEVGETVYVGGMPAGFTLKTGGAQVIGLSEIVSEGGVYSPASQAGMRAGDIIQKAAGISVKTIAELNEIVDKTKGKEVKLEVLRGGEKIEFSLHPVKEVQTGRYKIGVLVRESISGIGTVTYIDKKTGRFGSLGHPVVGGDSMEMQVADGFVYACSIVGVHKGVRGKAGELRGMFLNDKCFGSAEKLSNCGIFGQISQEYSLQDLTSVSATSNYVKPGSAYIYSTVSGVLPKRYEIEIVKVDKNNRENKNFVIKVIDEDLISETGGIVQGMSGSPILQEGKLVGAVTHVFLNDPTRGYGIEIEKMLCE